MSNSENDFSLPRLYIFILLNLLIFVILTFRLYNLQIQRYTNLATESVKNMYRRSEIPAPRGIMYDRYNVPLVYNQSNYDLVVFPFIINDHPDTWDRLANILSVYPEQLKEHYHKNYLGKYHPTRIFSSIDFTTLTRLQEHRLELPGIELVARPSRIIKEGANGGHIFGYTNEIERDNIKKGYKAGDIIGVKGLEKSYETDLRGKAGVRYIKVNALGQDFGEDFGKTIQPLAGNDLFLTIDWELQSFGESLFEGKAGGAIIIDYTNGEILTFISKPDFNPGIFSGVMTPETWAIVSQDSLKPMFNRLIQAQYPPGSTFKIITALAGLENNFIEPENTFNCNGAYKLGNRTFKCWKPEGHGKMDMINAIEHSCNVYFYNLIQRVGISEWDHYSALFGFGSLTGIDLPDEASGVLPNEKYMDAHYGKSGWGKGNLLNLGIGQGEILVTTTQLARYTAAIASRGKLFTPHLVKAIFNQESGQLNIPVYPESTIDGVSDESWDIVCEGMRQVVQGTEGTARFSNVTGLKLYGKTGTAQNPHGENHAWFISFSAHDNLPYAIIILVENGGSGSGQAAPIAKKMYEYLKRSHKL